MMTTWTKLSAAVSAATFFGTLALPSVWSALNIPHVDLADGRQLSTAPRTPTTIDEARSFASRYERYFDDTFAPRNHLRLAHAHILRDVFAVSETPQVVIGATPWLFYTEAGLLDDYHGLNRATDQEKETWRAEISERSAFLQKRGITYAFYVAPNKVTIYGEHLPPHMHAHPGTETRLDGITAALADSGLPFFDQRTLIQNSAHRDLAYRKTDSHWNQIAAFTSYTQIATALHTVGAIESVLPRSRFVTSYWPAQGDLSKLLTIPLYDELVPHLRAAPALLATEVPTPGDFELPKSLGSWDKPAFYENKHGKNRLLFIGDSFSWVQRTWFAEHFRNSLFLSMHVASMEQLQYLVEGLNPDVVIEERAERNMKWTPRR